MTPANARRDPTGPQGGRAQVIDGALHALLTSAPAALRALLSPSRLVGSGQWTMSRDTAYRLFREDEGFHRCRRRRRSLLDKVRRS